MLDSLVQEEEEGVKVPYEELEMHEHESKSFLPKIKIKHIKLKKKALCCGVTLSLCTLLGILVFSSAWISTWYLNQQLHDGIAKGVVIDSPHASGYKDWYTNYNYSGAAPLYYQFWLYNLSNLEDVRNGDLPKYQYLGPYKYRAYQQKFNVSFSQGGNVVTYNQWNYYKFLQEDSQGTEEDVVVNMNPAYTAVMSKVGSEDVLQAVIAGPALRKVFVLMGEEFIPDVVHRSVPDILLDRALLLSSSSSSVSEAFLRTWANGTKVPSPGYSGMLLSQVNGDRASLIALPEARSLFNRTHNGSLLDYRWNSTQRWRKAAQGCNASISSLALQFGLTSAQTRLVARWLSSQFSPKYVYPNITRIWGTESVQDVAYVQWGQGSVAGGRTLKDLYPQWNLSTVPELPLWYKYNTNSPFASLSYLASKTLLNGTYGIFDLANLGELLQSLGCSNSSSSSSPGNPCASLKAKWDIDYFDVPLLAPYFADISGKLGTAMIEKIIEEGGGLFTHRTVHQWLWHVDDPLLLVANPSGAEASLIGNHTLEYAKQNQKPEVCFTGKSDINKIGEYIEWRGIEELVGVYNGTVPISGTNNQGQFRPFLTPETHLYTWDNSYVREIHLEPLGHYKVKGVNLLKYSPSNETWQPNPKYYQSIVGFANLSGYENGAAVMLSNPHMFGADPSYIAKLEGMAALQNASTDITRIGIEPASGAVVDYLEGAQINLYFTQEGGRYQLYNGRVQSDVIYPVCVVRESSHLTQEDADLIKKYIYDVQALKTELWWSFFSTGAFVILSSAFGWALCACMVFKHSSKKRRTFEYTTVPVVENSSASSEDADSVLG